MQRSILSVFTALALSCLTLSAASPAQERRDNAPYRLQGLQRFAPAQRQQLEDWLAHAVQATQQTLGNYPFVMHLHLYPRKSNQPVPWANTWRKGRQSVHFYVDTRFDLQRFIRDWTAYHELSHLALPYLGSWESWFAEGFASYMQYQIMARAGLLEGTPMDHYRRKLRPHLRWYNSEHSAASVARRLMEQKQYPAAYWGGAWFFVLADQRLAEDHNMRLTTLMKDYLRCCRSRDTTLDEVIASLDGLVGETLFSELRRDFEQQPAKKMIPASPD
ncbi:hypothetical protein [Bowmanella dokdonensis]|uniref:hypothetical protein n=1 Tax=Bowmanella dokdonensis TaxID=751969 RepID=UPI001F493987|nr:hypothetical protein [Bowmanella dokdonensis]